MNASTTQLQTKVEHMNRESDEMAATCSFNDLSDEQRTLVQKRLSCINGAITLPPAEYSALNTRIQILGSAIVKQYHRNHR